MQKARLKTGSLLRWLTGLVAISVSLEDAIAKSTPLPRGLPAQTTPPTLFYSILSYSHSDLDLIEEALAMALRYHECPCVKAMVKISNTHQSGLPPLSHPQEELTPALPFTGTHPGSWQDCQGSDAKMVLEFCRLSETVVSLKRDDIAACGS